MIFRNTLIAISTYAILASFEQMMIMGYDNGQSFSNEELVAFYESIPNKESMKSTRIFCRKRSNFFWYSTKMCGEPLFYSPDCLGPNIDISYVGLKPILIPELVASGDRDHILGRPLVRIGADSKICHIFSKKVY